MQQKAREALDRHITENVVSPSLRGSPTVIPGQPAQFSAPVSEPETVDIQVLRDALGRLRYMARNAAKRGTEANGPTTYEIKAARNALQKAIYEHEPKFAQLDSDYGTMMDQQRQVDQMLKTVRNSRTMHAANKAYGATSGSLGGSLPQGRMGIVYSALDKMLTNKAGAADAVAQYITKPGDPRLLQQLLKYNKPLSAKVRGSLNAGTAASIPAMRGLLQSLDDDEQ